MVKLIIESIIDDTLMCKDKIVQDKTVEETEEEFLERMLPEDSMMREMYEIGKQHYNPSNNRNIDDVEEKNKYISVIEGKGMLFIENIIEHTLFEIDKNKLK